VDEEEEEEEKEDFVRGEKGGRRKETNCCSLRPRHFRVVQNNVPYNTGLIVMTWVLERLETLLFNQWLSKR
jgi:hypothetical protein